MSYEMIARTLNEGRPVILDGGFGTELRRRRVDEIDDPHIWSVPGLLRAPRTVLDIHRDYLVSGADIITAGAFRTNSRALRKVGLDDLSRPLTRYAVELALEMRRVFRESRNFAVAGNLTMLEDCYAPELSPGDASFDEHLEKVQVLDSTDCDLLLLESISNKDEALAALRATARSPKPVWISIVLRPDSRQNPQLLDGTPIPDVGAAMQKSPRKPDAILFNCCPPEDIEAALPLLRSSFDGLIGAYANAEREYQPGKPWVRREDLTTARYAQFAGTWIEQGAQIVGGCCGTTPADIRAIRDLVGWHPRPPR